MSNSGTFPVFLRAIVQNSKMLCIPQSDCSNVGTYEGAMEQLWSMISTGITDSGYLIPIHYKSEVKREILNHLTSIAYILNFLRISHTKYH